LGKNIKTKKMKSVPFYYTWFLLLIPFSVQAQSIQKFTISGFINEKGSKESLPGVNVYIPKLKVGAVSNNYGFYTLTVPQDSVELLVSCIGYQPQLFKYYLGKNTQLDISLQKSIDLKEVEVSAEKLEKISDEVQMSKIDLPVEQIKNLPALLGEKDVLKAIQLLPGVQKGSEGSSGIYVRGGGPDQNLIILDDATVYNATHLFGFFSLFNGDALKSVELTKGGFPARYGGRLSSVIEMQMKDGDKEKYHAEVGIGLISSRATIEGPIIKNKASFLVSARRTYIDALAQPFIKSKSHGVNAGYYFYDLNAKLNYVLNYKNKIYLSGYFGKDKFYVKDKQNSSHKSEAALSWGNATATLRWNHLVNEKIFSNVSLIFTDFLFDIRDKETYSGDFFSLRYYSGIRDYSVKWDVDYAPTPKHFIRIGVLGTYHYFRPSASVIKSSSMVDFSNKTHINAYETAVYAEDDFKINEKWRANGGIRLSNFNVKSKSYFNPEPRISLRYLLRPDLSIKASYASMNQYLHLLSNSGFGLPTDLWVPATDRIKPQHSQQIALGLAKDLTIKGADYMVSLEGYYKKSSNIIGYVEGASFLDINPTQENSEFSYEDIVTSGKAESYGGEFFFQKKFGKLTGWIGYTLSWTWLQFDELNFGKRFPARYDRRHDISVVGIYKVSEKITLSATWVYGTGNAITLPLSSYQVAEQSPHPAANNYDYSNAFTVSDYGEKNSFRMAPYHRFDIAIQFHKIRKKYERTFELGVYNAYNRHNPFYYYTQYDPNTQQTKLKQVSLFPIIPSISWTWKF
jgi:hypothetical protein